MGKKILLPQLVSMLSSSSGMAKKSSETFIKTFFATLTDVLAEHENVRIKGFGTFKVNRVEARKSVNVSTGEEMQIPAHYKVVFLPDKTISEKINREFSWFEIVEIAGPPKTAELTPEEEERSEHLGEEIEKDFGEIEPVEPFGPIDPDDPEPGEPIPEDNAARENDSPVPKVTVVPPFQAPPPVMETPAATATQSVTTPDHEFDPYKLDAPKSLDPLAANPDSPYVTREELAEYITKADIKPLVRTVKKVKGNVDKTERAGKIRSRAYFIWTLLICAALITGGFFLVYYLLEKKITGNNPEQVDQTPGSNNAEEDTEVVNVKLENHDFIEAEITADPDMEPEREEEMPHNAAGIQAKTQTGAAPKSTSTSTASTATTASTASSTSSSSSTPSASSDIKAMDKVTSTRYLTTMAKEHYGNYNLWPYIYLENEAKLGHPDRIKPGTVIAIPDIAKYGIDPTNPKDIEKAKRLSVEIYQKYSN